MNLSHTLHVVSETGGDLGWGAEPEHLAQIREDEPRLAVDQNGADWGILVGEWDEITHE